jgi:hypothetical protein
MMKPAVLFSGLWLCLGLLSPGTAQAARGTGASLNLLRSAGRPLSLRLQLRTVTVETETNADPVSRELQRALILSGSGFLLGLVGCVIISTVWEGLDGDRCIYGGVGGGVLGLSLAGALYEAEHGSSDGQQPGSSSPLWPGARRGVRVVPVLGPLNGGAMLGMQARF